MVAKDDSKASPAAAQKKGRGRLLLALTGVLLLHLGLLAIFAPPQVIFSAEPTYTIDYALHYYQVDRAVQAYRGWGKLWGYDPLMLAGHPIGALEDLSSKTLELFVIAATRLGMAQGRAFNLYVLLVHLLLPFCALAVGWLFRLRGYRLVALMLLWVVLWFFDALFHWLWFCGMISWSAASYLTVLLIALLYRALDERRLRYFLLALPLGALLALLHPFAVLFVAPPLLLLYLRDARELPRREHIAFWIVVATAGATALVWLPTALKLKHYILDTDTFLRPTLGYLLSDYLDLTYDVAQTGMPVRTLFRLLCFVAGGWALWTWRRDGDRRYAPIALAAALSLVAAYLGGWLPVLRATQPYRQLAPAMLLIAVPAVTALAESLAPATLRAAARPIKLLLLLALVLLLPRVGRSLLFYFPELLPKHEHGRTAFGDVAVPAPRPMRHVKPPREAALLRGWLEHHNPLGRDGRVVVEDYMLGEYLAATSRLPILGGLVQRSIPQADSHLFRLQRDGALPDDKLRAYFERWAVRFVVVSNIKQQLEWNKRLLRFRQLIGTHRIYETTIRPSYFLEGEGQVVEQVFNRLRVMTKGNGSDVVLRFHWLETLACRPGCTVEREPVKGARVGFIRINKAPARFEIYNSYRFGKARWSGPRTRLPADL